MLVNHTLEVILETLVNINLAPLVTLSEIKLL
jgi:hypothetical protein